MMLLLNAQTKYIPWRFVSKIPFFHPNNSLFIGQECLVYEGESISKQPNLFSVKIHLFFFDVIAL